MNDHQLSFKDRLALAIRLAQNGETVVNQSHSGRMVLDLSWLEALLRSVDDRIESLEKETHREQETND